MAVPGEQNELTPYDTEYRLGCRTEPFVGSVPRAKPEYAAGNPTRMRRICADITARKLAEFETHELRRELAHSSRVTLLGQLSSSLAHQLNQPLGAILRNSEASELYLKMVPPDLSEVAAILEDIRKDDQRAGGVIVRNE